MKGIFLLSGLLPLLLLAGCRPCADDLRQDERLKKLYAERKDSPSEWRAKVVEDPYWVRRREQLLGGTLPLTREQLRHDLKRLENEIETGREWRSPIPTARIPRTRTAPIIDGNGDDRVWADALTYRGEYLLNTEKHLSGSTEWKLLYDEDFIYFFARIADREPIPGPEEQPFLGDSVELFLLPDFRLANYLEAVVSLNGSLYTTWAAQQRLRFYELEVKRLPRARSAARRISGGYCIEMRIPFAELPGYLLGNTPKRGETMNFMMIRCDMDASGHYTRTAPVPFLYDGHNIYGYIRGRLD